MFCNHCGKPIPEGSRFCAECGAAVGGAIQPAVAQAAGATSATDTSIGTRDQFNGHKLIYPRNPPLSPHLCWVNIVISGLAQIIHKQVAKGFLLLFVTIASNLVMPLILALSIVIISTVDAYMVGRVLKKGKPVGKWRFFPI